MNYIASFIRSPVIPLIEHKEANDTDDDDDDTDDDDDFLTDPIYKNRFVTRYEVDARSFLQYTSIWSAQRNLNENHICKLMENLRVTPHFMGSMQMIRDETNRVRLIDGQHRYQAIKRIMEEDSFFNMSIGVDVYDVSDIDSIESSVLFDNANNVLNIQPDDIPDRQAQQVISELSSRFPDMIRDAVADKSINRPRINKKILYNMLKKINSTPDCVLQAILNKNNQLGLMARKEFKVTDHMYKIAKAKGFYIGLLDPKLTWISVLAL